VVFATLIGRPYRSAFSIHRGAQHHGHGLDRVPVVASRTAQLYLDEGDLEARSPVGRPGHPHLQLNRQRLDGELHIRSRRFGLCGGQFRSEQLQRISKANPVGPIRHVATPTPIHAWRSMLLGGPSKIKCPSGSAQTSPSSSARIVILLTLATLVVLPLTS
jgi:hypothetical protein